MARARTKTWTSVALVAGFALVTIVAADLALRPLAPPHPIKEVEHAIAEYENADPDVLVIGSSHGRTFDVLGDLLSERTGRERSLVAVPVEFGKLSSYEWVLEHRLKPLIEAERDGRLVRPSLDTFLLVTEWWDSCDPGKPAANIPARAWALEHFVADVWDEGLNEYNRNYLSNRWRQIFSQSTLVQDRGHLRLVTAARDWLRPPRPEHKRVEFEEQVDAWHAMLENGVDCIASPKEMRALEEILDYFEHREIETTILLYPRMPVTISDKAKRTTLARFAELMQQIAAERGLRFLDLTLDSPLTDEDFAWDFDHVLGPGNQRFSRWALDGPLSFLLEPPPAHEETAVASVMP